MTELGDVSDSLHVVFGATGAIGRAVVAELLAAGRDVRAVSRGGQAPGDAQGMAADAADPGQAARAAAGAAVIYHCASPPYTRWPKLFPPLTGSILGAGVIYLVQNLLAALHVSAVWLPAAYGLMLLIGVVLGATLSAPPRRLQAVPAA